MPKVALLATGGTIASRATSRGAVAAEGSDQLLGRVGLPAGFDVVTRDVLRVNGYAMTLPAMQTVLSAALDALAAPDVDGVVVTHGTDTMEETAFLVDVFLADPRPVVFTGAQRSADSPNGDGPANVRDALIVAGSQAARGLGALIVFDGSIFPARRTRKTHTLASAPFTTGDGGPVGMLTAGIPAITSRPSRPPPLDPGRLRIGDVRVDIVAVYPGCDAIALDAVAGAGARAVVLEATGAGNANPTICDAVARLTEQGVVVALSTRVSSGPVVPLYGGGGGVDLVAAGALPTGLLRPSQARILLAALLGTGADADGVRAALAAS